MSGDYVHFAGFVGDQDTRAVTVTIKRGTSQLDVLLLLTKVMEEISARAQLDDPQHAFNEVRLLHGSDGPTFK